jgi:hypothetical protein
MTACPMAGFEPKSAGNNIFCNDGVPPKRLAKGLAIEFRLTPPIFVGRTEKPMILSFL